MNAVSSTNMSGRFVVPEVVITHFLLREGDKVADFGAGRGYFVPGLSEAVGPEGRVYACEIQKSLIESIADTTRRESMTNVEVLWCDVEAAGGTKIDDGVLDAAIVVNTLFQMEQKEIAIAEMHRTLRSGGKLFIVDWSESFNGLGPQPGQVITESDTRALLESKGFTFERGYDAGDHHYGVAFRKP